MNEVERNLGFIFLRKFLVIKGQRYQIRDELIYRGYKVDVGVVEIRVDEDGKKARKQLEVDFVVNQGSKRYYIVLAYFFDLSCVLSTKIYKNTLRTMVYNW